MKDDILQLTLLCDFYGGLLTEKQRSFFEMYHFNDLSLSEIGDEQNISPQAVRDLLKRTENKLIKYEEQLGLVGKRAALLKKITAAENLADGALKEMLAEIKKDIEVI